MKRVVMKKILMLSLGLCVATHGLYPDELTDRLVTLQGRLKELSGILGTLGKKPRAEKPKIAESKDAAAKRAKHIKDFANKVDTLEIPVFEDFYQTFLELYFKPVFKESRLGKDLQDFSYGKNRQYFTQYTDDDIEHIKDTIGRAIFERNILQYCRTEIIELYDADRKQSGQHPLWVYEGEKNPNKMRDIIQNVQDKTPAPEIQALLEDTARAVSQAVEDMFYHAERPKGQDRVSCDCLTNTLEHGCYKSGVTPIEDEALRIPREPKHVLFYPINYLIFETMHVTLFHGYHLINKLILLFDFTKKIEAEVVVENKVKFKVGFDNVFADMMKTIVGKEDKIKDGLFTGNQLKSAPGTDEDKTVLELVFLGQTTKQPRMVIFGKKPDIYWSQTGYRGSENFPDGVFHPTTPGYEDKVTKEELTYALWYHIWRHTCYSVGLLPENLIPVLGLSAEKQAEVVKIEEKAHVNEDVKKELGKKAKDLMRVAAIVKHLIHELPKLKSNREIKFWWTEFKGYLENLPHGYQLKSIIQDEWHQIFRELSQNDHYPKIRELFANKELKAKLDKDLVFSGHANQSEQEKKAKASVKTIADVMLEEFDAADKVWQAQEKAKKEAEAKKAS